MKESLLLENLEITDVEIHGRGVARHNGKVVFVENALPGETVDAFVYMKKKGHAFARTVTIHHTSAFRTVPFCKHFGTCGGCTWQNVTYHKQLAFKRQFVEDAFRRIGKLDFPEIPEVIACEQTSFYRNKLEYTFSNKKWLTKEEMAELAGSDIPLHPALGFHKPGLFDKVIDIAQCHLQPEPSNTIRLALKDFAVQQQIPFFDLREQHGMLRTLIIRTSTLGETMVIVTFFKADKETIGSVMEFLKNTFPQITSLNYVINPRGNDALTDHEVVTYHGAPFIREQLEGLTFHIGPKSFFQVNVPQAERLFDTAVAFAGLQGDETVYDLYCGTGSISLYLARYCKKVIGVEQLEEAIIDAKENALRNHVSNCDFFAGDVIKILTPEFITSHGKPDVLFIDPPRAGVHPKLINTMLEMAPPKIIYVSCNPVTQARDIALLVPHYEIVRMQPVDMFPQTYHIENVAELRKVSDKI